MRSILAVLLLACAGAVPAIAAEGAHAGTVIVATDAKSFDALLAKHKATAATVLVELSAPWCVACKKLDPELDRLAAINPGLAVIRVDTDAVPALGKRFDAVSLPLLVKFQKGAETGRESGFVNGEVLAKWLGVAAK